MSPHPSSLNKATLHVSGMTCGNCEKTLEKALRQVPGIVEVSANHKRGTMTIAADAQHMPSDDRIEGAIHEAGYHLSSEGEILPGGGQLRAAAEIGGMLIVLLAIGKFLGALDLVSVAPSVSNTVTYGGIILIGLVAGTSSCLAVAGGLLVSVAATYHERMQSETPWQKFQPLLQFNIGRLVGYALLGGVVGLIGQSVTLSTQTTGYLNIVIALVMLYLGLKMLHLLPKSCCNIRPPRWISRSINYLNARHPAIAPFVLGAFTFFLPCGFTQSLQLVALASGSFKSGAIIMGLFALGTLPSLLGLSALSAAAQGKASHWFLRFSGAMVLILSIVNLQSGLALAGFDTDTIFGADDGQAAAIEGNVQNIAMKITAAGYEPDSFSIKAGVPVHWSIDGTGARGCTNVLVVPDLNISQPMNPGENVVDFTAPKPGKLAFSCSMGMVRGSFNVL